MNLSQLEFNTIRELTGASMTGKTKFGFYAEQAQDPQAKQILQQLSSTCGRKVDTFLKFL